jgi:ABC-type multidrug transport system ATPase subunit
LNGLLLDEPDSHLHPNNQKQLARELIVEAEGGLSVIVSTHSKHLVEALIDSSHVVWLKNGSKAPDVENYELKALLEIGALNAGERIGNPTYIFLTEDEKKTEFEVLLEANGYDLEECEVVAYSGCTNRNTAIALLNHLRKSSPEAKFAIHRDKDFLTPAELNEYRQKMESMNVKVFFPTGNDVESHFITAAHVASACNIDENIASEVIAAAFETKKDALLERYVNTRIENEKRAGRQINVGQVSVEAANLLTGPTSSAVHGKLMLKAIRNELQNRGIVGSLISSSPALLIPSLGSLWSR